MDITKRLAEKLRKGEYDEEFKELYHAFMKEQNKLKDHLAEDEIVKRKQDEK